MLTPVTYAVIGLSLLLLGLAGWYARADRILDDRMLAVAVLLELGLLVQAVRGLVGMDEIADGGERATFAAYLFTLPAVPVGTAYLALKEKSRWAMGAIAVGAFAVAVMTVRLEQIWRIRA